jgi:hypothetical protein
MRQGKACRIHHHRISGMAYSFYLFAYKQVLVRERKAFAFDDAVLLLESIAKNIRQSRATVMLDETRWVFLKPNGDTASYSYSDGALLYNKLSLMVGGKPIPGFSLTCGGNDSLLDINGDNEVGFNELDSDGDNRISGSETQSIAWIKATLSLTVEPDKSLETVERVKNNLNGDEGGFETYFKGN